MYLLNIEGYLNVFPRSITPKDCSFGETGSTEAATFIFEKGLYIMLSCLDFLYKIRLSYIIAYK